VARLSPPSRDSDIDAEKVVETWARVVEKAGGKGKPRRAPGE
jgi:hypothetical protein